MQPAEVDVWLEVGRTGRHFTYIDNHPWGAELGDLVRVKLRGRPMNGLVVARREYSSISSLDQGFVPLEEDCGLSEIEGIIQKAAVDSRWREWLDAMAHECYISPFRMLKAALPSGWLGQRILKEAEPKSLWWVELKTSRDVGVDIEGRQAELEDFLDACGGGAWQKDLLNEGFSSRTIKSLISIDRANREKRVQRDDSVIREYELEKPQPLTVEQKVAIDIFNSLPKGSALLLWGVTGSGKTEVYLQIAERELHAGRHCLILTPEIGLIPQLVDRFHKRFGARVLEYHSGCPEKEKVKIWRKILNSSTPLVLVGTRSAIFLPLSPLGLIVLDEEHDSSYKQDAPMPCYHARDLAISRAVTTGARVILGSATPSLFTWKNLEPNGKIALARLTCRISKTPLPRVHVVDMRQELAEGHRKLISRPVLDRLSALPGLGEQAVVLVPRRGYSTFLSCRSCGEVVQCPNCDVALTVHRGPHGHQWLRCHWCDYRSEATSCCNECGSKAFKPFGAGTQRVLDHLVEELEGVRFLRFDRDTTGGRDGHRRLLKKFEEGEADVLVGTQMLSKGMDLPRVTLAVVLAADGLLHRPDLFATEQSLQLFLQLAGRAGRGTLPGSVLVQTYCPDHPVILHLVDGRYQEFLNKEIKLRKEAGLPPYCRACLLRLAGESASVTATAAAAVAEQVRPLCETMGWSLIGPAPALIARIAGRSRWQILLHGSESSSLPLPVGNKLWDGLPKGVTLSVDPDPLSL